MATGAVCCWDASPAYESSSTSGSDSYAASPAICPEYISGDRSPHTPAPHALTGFIFFGSSSRSAFLSALPTPADGRGDERPRRVPRARRCDRSARRRALQGRVGARRRVRKDGRTEGGHGTRRCRPGHLRPRHLQGLVTPASEERDRARRRVRATRRRRRRFVSSHPRRELELLGRRRYGRRRCRRLFTRRDLPRGLRRLPRRVQDETGRGARGGRRLIPARLYPRRPREGRDGRRRRRRRRAGPVLGDVIEEPRPIRDETNKKVSGARRGRPNPSPPVHPRAPRARPVRSQRRRSLSHPHARGCVAVGRDVTTRAPTRVDASVLQRRRRRKILRHLLRSGHRVERAYAGVRQDTRRVCSRRVRLGGCGIDDAERQGGLPRRRRVLRLELWRNDQNRKRRR